MTAEGVPLVRMANLLEVDELLQVSNPKDVVMKFVVRIGELKEMVEINTADLNLSVMENSTNFVSKILFDAARRVRKRFERQSMSQVDFAMLVESEHQAYMNYWNYKVSAVSSVFGLSPDVLSPVEDKPRPANRFAAIAEEMENT